MLPKSVIVFGIAAASAVQAASQFESYTISASGIKVTLLNYGARVTHFLVDDKNGKQQDIVVGYDDPKYYLNDTSYFGPIVGRYANRIRNGTFTIDGVKSQITLNDHNGLDTLHGGTQGYDARYWNVVSHNATSITFSLMDLGFEGFPGNVITYATYAVSEKRFTSNLVSMALDEKTPIMLANHIYWNLDAFTTGPGKNTLDNTLQMPYADRIPEIDGILIPTGKLLSVAGTPFDFTSPKTIGKDIKNAKSCGTGCVGYDNAFFLDRPRYSSAESAETPQIILSSPHTGIKMEIRTNQQSMQMYSCNFQAGTVPAKASQQHGGKTKTYVEKYGCTVFETQQWIDGVNHPEWGQQKYQIFDPSTGPAVVYGQYDFSTI